MQTYLSALGYDIWKAIKNGYTTPSTPIIDVADKKLYRNNSKGKNAIMCRLVDSDLVRLMSYTSTK